jgi:hypothetical protein
LRVDLRAAPGRRRVLDAAGVLLSFGAGFALYGAGLAACGGRGSGGEDIAWLAPIRLLHDPPVGRLSAEQLRSLSMECGKYPRHDAMRGRYDAAYCEEAMAAWADSPLQMLTIPPSPPLDGHSVPRTD